MNKGPKTAFTIVMAEDDEDDRLLAQDAIEEAGSNYHVHTVHDGQELLDYLNGEGKYSMSKTTVLPSVILLDLNMPILDGRETLRALKLDTRLAKIPVVILSTSSREEDISEGYALGASSYLVKPNNFTGMVKMIKIFNDYWFNCASVPYAEVPYESIS